MASETMAPETRKTAHLEIQEMSITEDQVRKDWATAVGLSKLEEHSEALTIQQLMALLNLPTREMALGWARRGVAAGTVKELRVFRQSNGGGHRLLLAYKLIGTP